MTYKPQVLLVSEGGTGVNNLTANAILLSGASASSAFQTVASLGTSGQYLASNGAATKPTFQTGSGSLVQLYTTTANASASIEIKNWTTGFNYYKLILRNMVLATNNQQFILTVSTDGGSSYSATGYYEAGYQQSSNAGLSATFNTVNGSSWALVNANSNSSTSTCNIEVLLFNLDSASLKKNITSHAAYQWQGGTEGAFFSAAGMWNTTTAVNALKIATSSGNINSGTIIFYGIR